MILSEEQINIINIAKKLNENEILKINAFAGTGKTTTLNEISKNIYDKTFLYLAFNNDIVKDAKKKFKGNVVPTTVNSLAYKNVIIPNGYNLAKQSFSAFYVGEILSIDFSDAYDVLRIYSMFCNSDYKTIDEIKSKYIPKRLDSFEYAQILYDKIKNKELECDHSFYLKEYELSNLAKKFNYDYILLDEAQDTNPVTLSIFNQLSGRKILVGDTHQTIYQFRDSVNAMETICSDYTCYLSTTYRCNQKIVDYANIVLKKFKKENVELVSGILNQDLTTINETAYITRTNSEIIKLIQKLDNFDCKKNLEDIFGLSLDIYKTFISDKKDDFKSKKYEFLNKFNYLKDLKEYAKKVDDVELTGAVRNAEMFKGYLFVLFNKAKTKQDTNSKNKLITAHKSKGLEYDEVKICEDFKNPENCDTSSDFICESNLLYVAITRAKKNIEFLGEGILDAIY
ncbi:3'-5' exonuclease [Aliarcobacter lanthieri]|uniref:3'-5' exonuclease n=1 Tax=Aliarcobacter lanthieri TaxID=1355374 RepID=UPI00047B62FE|nr:3'-5' exonuclease [Aliarcobacter lanthieri]QKF59266.1 UvrD/REP helicase domain-containing protein [Aliarcobacter lanthieri]